MEDWIKEYWLKALFGGSIGLFGWWGKKKIKDLECKIKEQELIKGGVQALLRNDIMQQYEYWIEKQYFPTYARDTVQNMYDKYHGLGENGVIDGLIKKLFELPTERED